MHTILHPVVAMLLAGLCGIALPSNQLTAQSCPGLGTLTMGISPLPAPTISAPGSICPNGNGTVSVTQNFNSYTWSNGATDRVVPISEPGDYSVTVTNAGGCTGTAAVSVLAFNVPDPLITETANPCSGQVTLNAGIGYLAILWSTGNNSNIITVTTPGDYTVTVTNTSGCTASTTYNASIPPLPQVSINGDTSLCNGAAVNLSANSANAGAYLWSTGQTGTAITITTGGTYSVTATNQFGCPAVDSIKITEHSIVQPVIAGPSILCDSAVATLSVPGNFLAYVWNFGPDTAVVQVQSAGTYTVTVTAANGCTATGSFSLPGAALPNPLIASAPYACNSLMILHTGTGFASYQWSNNAGGDSISVNTNGIYTVTVTNAQGCSGTNSFTVNIPAMPSVVISGQDSVCMGDNSILSVPSGFVQYVWNNGSGGLTLNANLAGPYSVTVTDSFGCTASDAFTVANFPTPSPQISGTTQICVSGNAIFSVIGNFAAYHWSTNENSSSISTNTAGTYTVTVTSVNGCTGIDTQTLSVGSNLQPEILEAPYACDGQINLDAGTGYAVYTWSDGQTTQSIAANSAGTYAVTVSDGNGCTGTSGVTISIPTNPQVGILGNNSFCSGNSLNLSLDQVFSQYAWSTGAITASISVSSGNLYTVTVTDNFGCTATDAISVQESPNPSPAINLLTYQCNGQLVLDAGSGFNLYSWSGPNGFTQNTAQVSITTDGQYSLVVTDANGCTGSASIAATIPIQEIVALNGPGQFCAGGAANISASGGFSAYLWSNGSTQTNISVDAAGVYTVTATDAQGCTSSATITLGLFQQQTPVISGPTAACPGTSVNLSAGSGFQTYEWSNGATEVSISALPPFTATVTVTDSNGCTGTATASVSEWTTPAPAISELPYNCNEQITIDAGPGFQYAWAGPNGFSNNSQQTIATESGTYTVTVTDGNGCKGTASIQISIPVTPGLSVNGLSPICPGQFSDLTASSGFVTYSWSNGQNNSGISINLPDTYSVTATDGNGCTVTASFVVEPASPLSPTLNGNTQICPGSSSVFQVSGIYDHYAWSNGASTASISVSQAGTYTVTVTDAAGCFGSSSIQLSLANVPAPNIVQSPYDCSHQISLSAGTGYSSYQWSTGAITQGLAVAQSGTYTVTVTNAFGCSGSSSLPVSIPANPVAQITGVLSLCIGNSAILTASGNVVSYQWSNGSSGSSVNISQSGTYTVTATDVYGCTVTENHTINEALPVLQTVSRTSCRLQDAGTQTFSFTAANGCDSTLTIVTSYEPNKPGLKLEMDSLIEANFGQEIQLNVSANFLIDSVALQSPLTLTCYNCITPSLIALSSGYIYVEVFDPEGCQARGEAEIKVSRNINLYIPNAIRPGSTENGFFTIFSGPEVRSLRNFHVFDRWGDELYSRDDLPINETGSGWDGTFRDQAVQPGVYVYYFDALLIDGSIVHYSGDITVVQ